MKTGQCRCHVQKHDTGGKRGSSPSLTVFCVHGQPHAYLASLSTGRGLPLTYVVGVRRDAAPVSALTPPSSEHSSHWPGARSEARGCDSAQDTRALCEVLLMHDRDGRSWGLYSGVLCNEASVCTAYTPTLAATSPFSPMDQVVVGGCLDSTVSWDSCHLLSPGTQVPPILWDSASSSPSSSRVSGLGKPVCAPHSQPVAHWLWALGHLSFWASVFQSVIKQVE